MSEIQAPPKATTSGSLIIVALCLILLVPLILEVPLLAWLGVLALPLAAVGAILALFERRPSTRILGLGLNLAIIVFLLYRVTSFSL